MMTATTTAQAMARPPLQPRPAYRQQEHPECERHRHTGDVEHVAKGVVGRRLIERRWLLNDSDEHHTSGVAYGRTLFCPTSRVNQAIARVFRDLAHEMRSGSGSNSPSRSL